MSDPSPPPAGGIRGVRRRPVDVSAPPVLVEPEGGHAPLVLRPGVRGVSLPAWAVDHRDQLTGWLREHGALLFRGFGLRSTNDFEQSAQAVAGDLYGEYGDLPRVPMTDKVFGSTPYPAEERIHFHNESSHMSQWPMRIFFFCAIAAESGGATPLLDCRRTLAQLDPALAARFEDLGVTYVRTFIPGVDVGWQQFFGTDDRAEVEARCAAQGTDFEWRSGDRLRIAQRTTAVSTHPVTGERVFFNQVLLHHPRALPEATRAALLEVYDPDELPRNVTFGDGTPIGDEVIDGLIDLYGRLEIATPWEVGDVLVLDNMLMAHARAPFVGDRKIQVAMSDIRTKAA